LGRIKICEFCGNRLSGRAEGTVCDPCDQALEAEWQQDLAQAEALHGRYCRSCTKKLPVTRYFHCVACRPDTENEESWLDAQAQGPKRQNAKRSGAL
jgi:hypothetical protein